MAVLTFWNLRSFANNPQKYMTINRMVQYGSLRFLKFLLSMRDVHFQVHGKACFDRWTQNEEKICRFFLPFFERCRRRK